MNENILATCVGIIIKVQRFIVDRGTLTYTHTHTHTHHMHYTGSYFYMATTICHFLPLLCHKSR